MIILRTVGTEAVPKVEQYYDGSLMWYLNSKLILEYFDSEFVIQFTLALVFQLQKTMSSFRDKLWEDLSQS